LYWFFLNNSWLLVMLMDLFVNMVVLLRIVMLM
jgi:hypothetical protein